MKAAPVNPLTGSKMDFSIGGILAMIFGGLMLFGIFGTTQKIARKVEEKINNPLVDFTPSGLASDDVKVVAQKVYRG